MSDSTPLAGLDGDTGRGAKEVLRPVLGFLANVTVVTALLVYFGWRRSETQAAELGLEESVFGMSTREYLLRSVGPVLVLLVGVGACGLAWVAADRRLSLIVRDDDATTAAARRRRRVLGALASAWLVLPALVWLLSRAAPALAFVLFPAAIGAGILLLVYGWHLRRMVSANRTATLASAGLLVAVCLFWTASNYAEVLGLRLARQLSTGVSELPGVVVYSEHRLHVDAPGVDEEELAAEASPVRFRYRGFRLLEHAGGKYFLVSDDWTPAYGVVVMLRDDDQSLRLDFVRDIRPSP